MITNIRIELLLLLLSFSVIINAQSPRFDSYTSIPGIKKLNTTTILQDNSGYMWFGTKNELLKYDGTAFTVYTTNNGLAGKSISALIEDSCGTLWVGHHSGLISRSNNDGFELFNPEEGSSMVEISSFFIDSDQVLWYTTYGEGVFYYTGKNRMRLYNLNSDDGLLDNYTYSIVQDSAGLIYIASDKGISVYDKSTNKFIDELTMRDGLPDNIVTHLEYEKGCLWVGMYERGICNYDIKNKRFNSFGKWDFGKINDFVLSSKSEIVVSTDREGVIQCRLEDTILTTNQLKVNNTLPSNRTNVIYCDREKNIWVGSSKGISIRKNNGIEFLDDKSGFNIKNVYAFTIDQEGKYWTASQEGLFVSEVAANGHVRSEKVKVFHSDKDNGLTFISVYCDTKGKIWAGTYGYGVFKIDPASKNVIHYTKKIGLSNNNVIHINGKNDQVWFSTLGGGLSIFNINANNFTNFTTQQGLSSDYVYSTFYNKDTLWCATDGGGVSLLVNNKLIPFDPDYFNTNAKIIYSILIDDIGQQWFNSPDVGLIRKNANDYKIINDSTFLAGSILAMAKTPTEIITVGIEGIEKHGLQKQNLIRYSNIEGVSEQKPNLNAVYTDKNYNVWVGTANGVIKLKHNEAHNHVKPKLSITEKSLFFNSLPENKHRFKYSENHFTFDFNALWFSNKENLQYRFKLNGYDLSWSEPGTNQKVTYSNLPHGDYEFEVQVNYPGGFWTGSKQAKYQFKIMPPFWKRAWFIILMIVSLINIIYWFIKYRIRSLEQAKRQLELEVQKRTAEIQLQKEEIEAQRDEIEKQRDYVIKQHDKIESQNKSITSSIQYASRIQKAVLPPDAIFDKALNEYFIFFKPRDIVSGDFYFIGHQFDYTVIAAVDCTGHGVPGAFMSILGASLLNQILSQADENIKAAEILNRLRDKVKLSLRQTGKENEAKDGMDIALCIIHKDNDIVQFAGAYNPLMIVRKGEIFETKGDKMPIGIFMSDEKAFVNHEIKTETNDMLYLFSDGYQDQFGGGKNRKFLPKRLRNLLIEIAPQSMEKQTEQLETTFNDWKQDEPQVDDVIVLGIRM